MSAACSDVCTIKQDYMMKSWDSKRSQLASIQNSILYNRTNATVLMLAQGWIRLSPVFWTLDASDKKPINLADSWATVGDVEINAAA